MDLVIAGARCGLWKGHGGEHMTSKRWGNYCRETMWSEEGPPGQGQPRCNAIFEPDEDGEEFKG